MRSRRRVRWAQFRVVCVSLVALMILGVVLYLLTGGAIFTAKATLFLYVPDATGIEQGSPVRVDGIDVGKVGAIGLSGSPDPNRVVRLSLRVNRDFLAVIPTGSYAELGVDDPAGDKFVDITSSGRGPLSPDSEIPYKASTDMFKTLDLRQFDANLREMDAVLTDIETGKSRVGQFVLGTQMYSDVRRRLAEFEHSVHAAANTTSALGHELYTDRLYRQLSAPVMELDRALAQLQSGQGAGGRLLRDNAQYERADAAIRGFRDSIRDIRSSSMMQSDTLYTDVNRWVVSLTQQVDEFNAGPMFAAPQTFESWSGFARDLEKTVREFRQDPRKYMRLKIF